MFVVAMILLTALVLPPKGGDMADRGSALAPRIPRRSFSMAKGLTQYLCSTRLNYPVRCTELGHDNELDDCSRAH